MRIFTNAHYDFIRWRWHAIACRWSIILAGVGADVLQRGLPLGIDFTGGTIVILKFQKPTSESDVRRALDAVPGEEVVQAYGDPAQNQVLVRLPLMKGAEQGYELEQGAKRVVEAADGREPRAVRGRAAASWSGRSSAPTCSARASTRRSRRLSASPSTSPSASVSASRSAPWPRRCTTSWSRWRSWSSSATSCR